MRGLTPEERAALIRMTLPVDLRSPLYDWSHPTACASLDLVEQGRATYEPYGFDHPRSLIAQGRFDITPAGREALRLHALLQALETP